MAFRRREVGKDTSRAVLAREFDRTRPLRVNKMLEYCGDDGPDEPLWLGVSRPDCTISVGYGEGAVLRECAFAQLSLKPFQIE